MKTSCFVAVILFLWGGVLIGLGKEVIGTTVLQETYIPKKQVDIYYMPYSAGDVKNVAFADITDEPGNNQIGHGFWLMFFGYWNY